MIREIFRLRTNRQGIAIPMVCLFVTVIFIFFFYMDLNRRGVRKQNLVSHSQKKAYYMAMGAIQHALLKFRILQRNAYDAACLARGVCPFFNAVGSNLIGEVTNLPNKCDEALKIFQGDLRGSGKTDPKGGIQFMTADLQDPDLSDPVHPWRYEIASISILSYHTNANGTIRISLSLSAMGYAYDKRVSVGQERIEFVKKEVYLEKKLN